jgi:8-oxo-dGTP pyrophosphatase MutT (NUDIX family)
MTELRSSCVLVIRERDHRILGVSRKDGSGFALPGGKAEPNETPRITACRELNEEVGSMTTPSRLVKLYEGLSSSGSGRLVTVYFAHKITNEPHAVEYGTTIGWFDFTGLLNSSPFAAFYMAAFPDGVEHLLHTEILVLSAASSLGASSVTDRYGWNALCRCGHVANRHATEIPHGCSVPKCECTAFERKW